MNILSYEFAARFIDDKLGSGWQVKPHFETFSNYRGSRNVYGGGTVIDPSLSVVSFGAWGYVNTSDGYYDLSGCNSDVLGYLDVLGIDPTNVLYGAGLYPFMCLMGAQNEVYPQGYYAPTGFCFMPLGARAKTSPFNFTELTRGNFCYFTPSQLQYFDSDARGFLSPVQDFYLFGHLSGTINNIGAILIDTNDIVQASDIGATLPNTLYQNKYKRQGLDSVTTEENTLRYFAEFPCFFNTAYLPLAFGDLKESQYSFIGWKCSPLQSGTPPTTQIPLPFVS